MWRNAIAILLAVLIAHAGCTLPPVTHIVIVSDRSGSAFSGGDSRCDIIVGLASEVMSRSGVDSRSTLTVLATGDAKSGDNPLVVMAPTPIPILHHSLEAPEMVQEARERMLVAVRAACESRGELSKTSPIALSVVLGIQQLRSQGCVPDGRCLLLVQSDLSETQDEAMTSAINHEGSVTPHTAGFGSQVDSRGIEIRLCGLGEGNKYSAQNSVEHSQRTIAAWSSLLRSAASLTFQPICPRSASGRVSASK